MQQQPSACLEICWKVRCQSPLQLWPDGSKLLLVTVSWWDSGQKPVCRLCRWTLNEVNKVRGDRNNYFKASLFNWERNLFFLSCIIGVSAISDRLNHSTLRPLVCSEQCFSFLSPKLSIKDFWTKTVLYIAQLQPTWKRLPIAITTSNDMSLHLWTFISGEVLKTFSHSVPCVSPSLSQCCSLPSWLRGHRCVRITETHHQIITFIKLLQTPNSTVLPGCSFSTIMSAQLPGPWISSLTSSQAESHQTCIHFIKPLL